MHFLAVLFVFLGLGHFAECEAPTESAGNSTTRKYANGIGAYTWGSDLWVGGSTTLVDFLTSPVGHEWFNGDVYINIADYSTPDKIHHAEDIIGFVNRYRKLSRSLDNVVWLTYGDISGNGASMLRFAHTFFKWASNIPNDTAASLGKIGISFDVEHVNATHILDALQVCTRLRGQTKFASGQLLIQHTIEGGPVGEAFDYIMRYADSALMMLYRNYMHDPSGRYKDDSNLLSRFAGTLHQNCPQCLNDTFAAEHYGAKLTIMVEAACSVEYCNKISFCAKTAPNEGMHYIEETLSTFYDSLVSSTLMNSVQRDRLLSPSAPFALHHWRYFRCFAPFPQSLHYPACQEPFQLAAEKCRSMVR